MRWIVVLIAIMLVVRVAYAQQPPPAAERGLSASLQQIAASIELYADEMKRRLEIKDHEIAELKQKCGDPCKPPDVSSKPDKPTSMLRPGPQP